MRKINVLLLGCKDWTELIQIPVFVNITRIDRMVEAPNKPYDITFIDRAIYHSEFDFLKKAIKAHTVFVLDRVKINSEIQRIIQMTFAQSIKFEDVQEFLDHRACLYFSSPYGEKLNFKDIAVAQSFNGKVRWNSNYKLELEGDFGSYRGYEQIAYWRYNVFFDSDNLLDFWLEYDKDESVSIKLVITAFSYGEIATVQDVWEFEEDKLNDLVSIHNSRERCNLFVSLLAEGSGKLSIIALHNRFSRKDVGVFIPGGKRSVTSKKEEVFTYFDPGNLKPPLNVYFSGYKTQEGFEGFNLFRNLGCPFLLVSEA